MTFKPLIFVPFLATPAFAGSLDQTPVEPAPVAPVAPVASPVTGDWTGPSVGVQLGYGYADPDGPEDETSDGAVYGLNAYYDHDFGNWIAGAGVEYEGTNIDLGEAGDLESMARVGGRLGYDLGKTMVYGQGGYARAMTDGGSLDADDSNGYYVGVGAETYVAENVTLSGDVKYNEFSDFDNDDLELGTTTATVGLNYRF